MFAPGNVYPLPELSRGAHAGHLLIAGVALRSGVEVVVTAAMPCPAARLTLGDRVAGHARTLAKIAMTRKQIRPQSLPAFFRLSALFCEYPRPDALQCERATPTFRIDKHERFRFVHWAAKIGSHP